MTSAAPTTNSSAQAGAAAVETPARPPRCIALMGNPNTGKTTLFNRLCGLRTKTANFPGSTVEAHIGTCALDAGAPASHIVDLPGIYSLYLDRPESLIARDYLEGRIHFDREPEALLVVVDATNLSRNLVFAGQALQLGLPAVIALNMSDLAQKRGLTIDAAQMSEYLGVDVVPVCARTGEGFDRLKHALSRPRISTAALPDPQAFASTSEFTSAGARWANGVFAQSVGGAQAVGGGSEAHDTFTDRLDAAFTHPVLGLAMFVAVMAGLFWTIFAIAGVPMDLIETTFALLGGWTHSGFEWMDARFGWQLSDGPLHDLIVDGVIAGIAGTVVFLPQICLLFFLISLLEDTGYLARASFVMDRLLRRFGLPGQAFVPMLSAHACAIPAIMATRLIPDQRDRFAAILVTPFLSCSARLPVYVLLISVLFADRPLLAGLAFTGCYALGATAALLTALLFRRTILKGPSRPMVLELPSYKMPSIRNALLVTYDRAMIFLRKAGTVIVAICIVLWWLGSYPIVDPPAEAVQLRERASQIVQGREPSAEMRVSGGEASMIEPQASMDEADELLVQADAIERRHAKAGSFIGRIGRTVEPVFAPLGYDWQLSIGVLSSFLAREVFVSTMAVVLVGADEDEAEEDTVRQKLLQSTRGDGSPVFTTATSASLLVFYVLAMQCLPTLAVTRRETGSWKWALLQLGYMTAVAYVFALVTYWICS